MRTVQANEKSLERITFGALAAAGVIVVLGLVMAFQPSPPSRTDGWEIVKDATTIAGAVLGVVAVWRGVLEYQQQSRIRRSEFLQGRIEHILTNRVYQKVELACFGEKGWEDVSLEDRRQTRLFFEEVALLVQSGIMRPEVAMYFFGPAAVACDRKDEFWEGDSRDSPLWALFRGFVTQMGELERAELDPDPAGFVDRLQL